MRTNKRLSNVVVAAVAYVLVLASAAAVPGRAALRQQYSVTDLGTLGGARSVGFGINNRGQVVGWAETGALNARGQPVKHAYLWDPRDGMRDLGTLGGENSWAVDLNDAGQVVGGSETGDRTRRRAFLWKEGSIAELGRLPGHSWSEATAINRKGEIVGLSNLDDGLGGDDRARGFLWRAGVLRQLPGPPRDRQIAAWDINDSGVIVASSYHLVLPERAWRTRGDRWFRLRRGDSANAVNDLGQIVGSSRDRDRRRGGRALLWSGLRVFDLGWGSANAINNRGEIIGERHNGEPAISRRGRMRDFSEFVPPDSGWVVSGIHAINDEGTIAGTGWHRSAEFVYHALLLTPVPSARRGSQ